MRGCDDGDMISKLPDDLIARRILPLLPFEEAVRTSVLCRRFSHLWRSTPSIVLDRRFHRDVLESKLPRRYKDPPPWNSRDDPPLEEVVDAILATHTSPILAFNVYAFAYNAKKTRNWLQTMSTRGVRELGLACRDWPHLPVNVPSSLFSYTQLTSLKLRNFALVTRRGKLRNFGFPRLVRLELDWFQFDSEIVSMVGLLANCPLLEDLTLRKCRTIWPGSLADLHAPNLKRVHICMCGTLLSEEREKGDVLIPAVTPYCPNLTRVTVCSDPVYSHPQYRTRGFGLSSSEYAQFHVRDLLKLLGAWSGIESLCFGRVKLVRCFDLPGGFPVTLRRLKDLTLHWVNFQVLSEVSFLISIVESSPNLEKLVLIGSDELEATEDCREVMDFLKDEKSTLWKLERVELRRLFVCVGPVIRLLVRFLSENSPSLETVAIEKNSRLVWQIQEELEKTSSKAKIAYLTYRPKIDTVCEHEP